MARYTLSKVMFLFRKFGGARLIWAYAKLGMLGVAIRSVVMGVIKRRPADKVFYSYEPRIISALQERYRPLMKKKLTEYERDKKELLQSDIVWFCWLQGLESAPPVVKACYASLKKNLVGKEIKVVDESNRRDYVQLPDYIERRYKKGQIPPAMFADLLRLELLIKYGGTWIDATVLCTGADYPQEFMDSDLFFFQYAMPDNRTYTGISNWFITASANNVLLMTLRDVLYAYWKDFNCVVEYFIFHRFFDMLAAMRPDDIAKMPYGYSPYSHTLQRHWQEPFDQKKWDRLTSRVQFHKLAHQMDDSLRKDNGNYYYHVLQAYGD